MDTLRRNKWVPILLVLLVGFGLRVALLDVFPNIPTVLDQGGYQKSALKLLRQGIAVWNYDLRAPGYILFLAGNFWFSGGADKIFVRLLQSLISTGTIACVYAMTQLAFVRLGRPAARRAALLSAVLLALYPDYIFFSQTLWSETLFVFLATLGLVLLLRAWQAHLRLGLLAVSGLVFGLAVLSREALVLFAAGLVPLWLLATARPNYRRGVLSALVFLLPLALVILPWTARNYVQGRGVQLISSQGVRDFWMYNLLALEPDKSDRNVRALRRAHAGDPGFDARMRQEITERIAANPGAWVLAKSHQVSGLWRNNQSTLTQYGKVLRLFTADEAARFEPFLQLLWLAVLGFAIVGFLYPSEFQTKSLFLLYLLSWIVIIFMIHYMERFRLGLIPFLLPYTAIGILATGALVREIGLRITSASENPQNVIPH